MGKNPRLLYTGNITKRLSGKLKRTADKENIARDIITHFNPFLYLYIIDGHTINTLAKTKLHSSPAPIDELFIRQRHCTHKIIASAQSGPNINAAIIITAKEKSSLKKSVKSGISINVSAYDSATVTPDRAIRLVTDIFCIIKPLRFKGAQKH